MGKTSTSCLDAQVWLNNFVNNPPLKVCGQKWWCQKGASQSASNMSKTQKYSQGEQDAVLTSLFDHNHLGTTNKQFAEFGFPDSTFDTSYGNGRYLRENLGFKEALLLDGKEQNETIHLYKRFVTQANIVNIFDEFGVPKETDYVSVDIDSCDLWIFYALTSKYRPRVM